MCTTPIRTLLVIITVALWSTAAMAATKPDLHGVTPIDSGLWAVATQGTIHIMGYNHSFAKNLQQCVKPGQKRQAVLPPGKGHCVQRETTAHGVMQWHMTCQAPAAQVNYDCIIKTAKHDFNVHCRIHNSNPASTTDYTARAHWLKAACQ